MHISKGPFSESKSNRRVYRKKRKKANRSDSELLITGQVNTDCQTVIKAESSDNFTSYGIDSHIGSGCRSFALHAGEQGSIPVRDSPLFIKQVMTFPLQTLENRCDCCESAEITLQNGCPVSQ